MTEMCKVIITWEAEAVIRSAKRAEADWKGTAVDMGGGYCEVDLSLSTLLALYEFAAPGESPSDAIIRLITTKDRPLS